MINEDSDLLIITIPEPCHFIPGFLLPAPMPRCCSGVRVKTTSSCWLVGSQLFIPSVYTQLKDVLRSTQGMTKEIFPSQDIPMHTISSRRENHMT